MKRWLTLPNQVTMARIGLVFFLPFLIYPKSLPVRFLAVILAIVLIFMDWLDGFLARHLRESTEFGGLLDIAGDRIVESVFWILLADVRLIPVWIPLVVVSRGILTDTFRAHAYRMQFQVYGKHTFHQTKLARFLTGHPIMRTGYAVLKGFTFALLLLSSAFALSTSRFLVYSEALHKVGLYGAVITAIVCLVRGIPVLADGLLLVSNQQAIK